MTPTCRLFILILLAGGLAAASYSYYCGQRRQAAVLEKLTLLESSIASANQQTAWQARNTVQQIGRLVSRNHHQARDMMVLQGAQLVWTRAQTLADTLQSLRAQLRATDVRPNSAPLQHPTQTTSLGTDEVNQLAAHLDRYAAFIKEYAPSTATLTQPINHLGKADNFNAFYFKKAPLGGILATFTQLEAQVRRSEIEALMVQSQKFGSGCCFCFDRIGILAVAESNTVAPGALYRAQLLLSQSISDVEFSTVSVNGRALLKDANRQNTVKFRIPLAHPGQPDTVQAQWHGTIRAIAFPGDTTWQLDVPYFIVKQPKP